MGSLAMAAVTAVTVGAVSLSGRAGADASSGATLRIEAANAAVATDGHHVRIEARVGNRGASGERSGLAWWILSVPGQEPPWQHDVYHSRERPLDLAPGSVASLGWEEDALVPSGTYTVSLWVHEILPGGNEVHSDGLDLVDLRIPVGGDVARVTRHGPPEAGVSIVAATAAVDGSGDPVTLHARAAVTNGTETSRSVTLRWDLVDAGRDLATGWWGASSRGSASSDAVEIGPAGQGGSNLDRTLLVPLGADAVRLTVLMDGAVADQVLLRDVAADASTWDPSILRASLPAGPVAITSLSAAQEWADGAPPPVDVALLNMSDQPQAVRAWWTLLPARRDAPSGAPVAALDPPLGATVPPHTLEHLTLPPPLSPTALGAGSFRLRAWVHTRGADGAWTHSDGVERSAAVEVPTWDASLVRGAPPAGPIVVEAIAAPARWTYGDQVNVLVRLRNASSSPQSPRVWWILGRVGDLQPYLRPAATLAPALATAMAPGEVRTVTLTNVPVVAPGHYSLSVWAHVRNAAGQDVHSDGALAAGAVAVAPYDSSITRAQPPGGPVDVESVTVGTSWTPGDVASVGARLVNQTAGVEVARVYWILGAPGDRQPFLHPAGQLETPVTVEIGPYEVADVDLSGSVVAMPGRYALSVWVHVEYAGGIDVHSDDVDAAQPVSVGPLDPSVTRTSLPSGGLMIRVIDAAGPVAAGGVESVSMMVSNLTLEPQVVRASWALVRPADASTAVAVTAANTVTLAAGAEVAIVVSGTAPVAPGTYTLAAQVEAGAGGQVAAADQVQARKPVSVTAG